MELEMYYYYDTVFKLRYDYMDCDMFNNIRKQK